MQQLPKQKIAYAKKTKEWREQCIEALISRSRFATTHPKLEWSRYYDAYYGKMESSDYSYVLNPYNTQEEKYRKFPARLRNFNIIAPVIDLHMGEKTKRPKDFMVVAKNSSYESELEEQIRSAIIAELKQEFVNELNAQGVDTGFESRQTKDPKQVEDLMRSTYKDARAIMGQEALDYIMLNVDFDDKTQEMFFHWLVSGFVASYRGVEHDEVVYETVSPFDIDYEASDGVRFGEDADQIVVRRYMTPNAVIDRFYDLLADEQVDQIESPTSNSEGFRITPYGAQWYDAKDEESVNLPDREVEVMHCCWKSFSKVGILTYYDELGMAQQIQVSEEYRPDKENGESVEWFWISEAWEGWRIDRDIYVGIQPIVHQRREMTNLSKTKLPYNFRIGESLVKTGMAYQALYNIFHYRLEMTIAKNKDKIMLMEINTIPKRHGWTEDKFMYTADAMGWAFIDSTAEGKDGRTVPFNQFQVMDMSLGQYIAAQFQLLTAVREEWEERAGVPRQRKGQVFASDSVGATERSIFQASVITEERVFRRFEKFEERDVRALHDVSKYAWRNGKKEHFVTRDGRESLLSIDDDYMETEYGIFARNSGNEREKLETLKQLSQAFAQNDASPEMIAEILDATSFARLKVYLREAEEKRKAYEQSMQEQQLQAQSELVDKQNKAAQEQRDWQANENELDRQNKIEVKRLEIDSKDDSIDREKLNIEREKIRSAERMASAER